MGKNYNNNNNNELNGSLTGTEAIINRLKEAVGVKSDGQMATFLGISRQNIGAARKRDDVPPGWIDKVAELTGCSMDWLRFGRGPKIRAAYTTEGSHHDGRVATTQSPYDLQVSPESGPLNESASEASEEDGSGFGAAVEMLAKIYSSGDKLLISTIGANIRAFCEAIDGKQREQRSTKELENLKNRLTTIEKQLQQAGSPGKKGNKANSD
jgi:hypothetical protein